MQLCAPRGDVDCHKWYRLGAENQPIQCAQKNSPFLEGEKDIRSYPQKLSTENIAKNKKKWSYTRSYSHYPHFWGKKNRFT